MKTIYCFLLAAQAKPIFPNASEGVNNTVRSIGLGFLPAVFIVIGLFGLIALIYALTGPYQVYKWAKAEGGWAWFYFWLLIYFMVAPLISFVSVYSNGYFRNVGEGIMLTVLLPIGWPFFLLIYPMTWFFQMFE